MNDGVLTRKGVIEIWQRYGTTEYRNPQQRADVYDELCLWLSLCDVSFESYFVSRYETIFDLFLRLPSFKFIYMHN